MNSLSGKKTYIVAGFMLAVVVLKTTGIIDSTTYESIMGLLAALGFGALRSGVDQVLRATEVTGEACNEPK
jgi:hypothetical protein